MNTRAMLYRRRRPVRLLLALALPLALLAGLSVAACSATADPAQGRSVPTPTTPITPTTPQSGWSLAFRDDFNGPAGSALNSADWVYDTGTSYPGGAAHWGTNEVETMTNSTSNVYLDGSGHMVIKALRDASGAWTSGRVETRRADFAAPAGGELKLSASIEQPNPANALGYWPAFWALGAAARPSATNWPSIGELDMMEDVNGLSKVSSTLHCGTDPGGPCNETNGISSGLLACPACQVGYHTYSVIVDRTNPSAEQLRFSLDGRQTYVINENQVPAATWQAAVDHGFFAIFDLAVGGSFPNGVCGCTSPSAATTPGAAMSVDWFAAYVKRP